MQIVTLNTTECTDLVAASRLGRLCCARDNQPYVVPVHFVHADNYLYAFSMPGKKIAWMRANPLVTVLVEEEVAGPRWRSVVVDGRYEELTDQHGRRNDAWLLLSREAEWWEPGAYMPVSPAPPGSDRNQPVFFRIRIVSMSGRAARD